MKLSLLLTREPIQETLANTLGRHLAERHGWTGEIAWLNRAAPQDKGFLINPKLNLIYPDSLSRAALAPYAGEYAYHPARLRRWAQTLYVNWAISPMLRKLTSQGSLQVTPWISDLDAVLIIPGNHSIRLINMMDRTSTVLAKTSGEHPDFTRSAIQARTQGIAIPGPAILDFSDDGTWYTEELIEGLPLNRTHCQKQQHSTLQSARSFLNSLYRSSAQRTPVKEWTTHHIEGIDSMAQRLNGKYPDSLLKRVSALVSQLAHWALRADPQWEIETVVSHGDFQAANIMIPSSPDQSLYLIDWEYSARRCRWFDAMVFHLNARSPSGLADRVQKFLANPENGRQHLAWIVDGSDAWKWPTANILVATFFIEEFYFRLQEASPSYIHHPDGGLRTLVSECESLITKLK